jgi:hypothetical protein
MSNGIFGSVIPADVDIDNDVEIFYNYKPSRGDDGDNTGFEKVVSPSIWITKSQNGDNEIEGLYNLRLPLSVFNKKGIYTVYIKPKENKTTVISVGTLGAYQDVKGIVISGIDGIGTNMVGNRIEFEYNHVKYTKIIRSCNYCTKIAQSDLYNLTEDSSSGLIFCTVTPSATSAAGGYAGIWPAASTTVTIVNTKFAPKMLEIEMTEHDIETLSYMLEGNQINDVDNGIITTLNGNNEVYHQSEYYTLKDKLGNPLYTVKKKVNDSTLTDNDINEIMNQG